MALSHATNRGTVFVPGGLVGDRRSLRFPGAVCALHAAFFNALGWLVLGSLALLNLRHLCVGYKLGGTTPVPVLHFSFLGCAPLPTSGLHPSLARRARPSPHRRRGGKVVVRNFRSDYA